MTEWEPTEISRVITAARLGVCSRLLVGRGREGTKEVVSRYDCTYLGTYYVRMDVH